MISNFRQLKHFCGTEFHQDWLDEATDWSEVVRRYMARYREADRFKNVANEIRTLVAQPTSDDEIDRILFAELGCYYEPRRDHKATRAWLTEVAAILEHESHRLANADGSSDSTGV